MRKHLDFCGDYIANNPFGEKKSFKHLFMEKAFLLYRKVRVSCSTVWPLKDWQQYMWVDTSLGKLRCPDNSAFKCTNEDAPSFSVEHSFILDLIPKESWGNIQKGIERFRFKHAEGRAFPGVDRQVDWFDGFNDGEAYSSLDTMQIKKLSLLSDYISQISFHVLNLGSSFLCLVLTLTWNADLVKRMSKYAVSNVSDQIEITGFRGRHWYEFGHLGRGRFSGSLHKCETIDLILEDITWHVAKEVQRFIPDMWFTANKHCPQYLCSVKTNIDGNDNEEFWRSLGIYSRFCDFSKDLSSCIAWRGENEPIFIFTEAKDAMENDLRHIQAYHIVDSLYQPLVVNRVSQHIRQSLSVFSGKVNHKRRSLKKWLKLKVDFDAELFFPIRLLREIKDVRHKSFSYISLRPKSTTIIDNHYTHLYSTAQKTIELYDGIINLINSNIEYRSTKSNLSMQNKALLVSVLSLIVALLAIGITLFDSKLASLKDLIVQMVRCLN